MPKLKAILFKTIRAGYSELVLPITDIKATIFAHAEFIAFKGSVNKIFGAWKKVKMPVMKSFDQHDHPKTLLEDLAEDLLARFKAAPLIDAYDIYQHFMDYWYTVMQDDVYLIAASGWLAEPSTIINSNKKAKSKDKGWDCDLIPKALIVSRYFAKIQAEIDAKEQALEANVAGQAELEEEHGAEEGFLGGLDKIAKVEINARLKELKGDLDAKAEVAVLTEWLALNAKESELKQAIKEEKANLDKLSYAQYAKLSVDEIKTLVVEDKWLPHIAAAVQGELDRVSHTLTNRIRILAERYTTPLPKILEEVEALSAKVDAHLKKMGAVWS